MLHKNSAIADNHVAHNWEYANAAARLAATGFVSGDLKKLALQLDTSAFYVLTATTPTWVLVGGGGGGGSGDVVGPASSVTDHIALFDGATGKLLKDGGVTLTGMEQTANKDSTGGYPGLTLFKLNLKNAANTFTNFFTNTTTAARTWTLPDKDGTVAMTSDITGTNSGTNTGDQTNISGNAATVTTNANLTGDVTSVGNATTLAGSVVIGKVLTGFTSGAGTITAADTILSAIQKLDGNVALAVGGGISAISVVSANGFTGSSSGGTTPAITLTTSITGLLKGNGTAISAAAQADVTALLGAGSISNTMLANSAVANLTGTNSGDQVASGVTTNTVNFLGSLSISDSNVQVALETLDRIERQSAAIASAATTDLATATGGYTHITGAVTITSFGTHIAGNLHHLVFDGAPLITHNATSLILPGGVNIQTAAGDTMVLRSEGNGTGTGSSGTYWRCVSYTPNAVGLAAHLADTVDAHAASAITNTPAGSIAATTVQAAIDELATEKANLVSPSFTTPALGTPASGVLTNCTGTASGLTAGNVTTNANLTGHITSSGNAAVLGSFTLAQLNTAVSDDNVGGLGTANTWTKPQTATVTALTSSSATIACDLGSTNNFSHTMTENTTLGSPSNAVAGTSGQIAFTQHASAAKTLAFHANWISTDGTTPAISTTVGAVNLLTYYVVDSTHVWFALNKHGVA